MFNIYYLTVSHDNYIYLAVDGLGLLKYNHQLEESKFDPNNHIFESLTVFPNPTNGLLSVYENVLLENSQEVFIYDVSGRLIHTDWVKIHENTVDLQHCPSGIYFLVMHIGDKVYRTKVVKI
ncbi:MAG: T9SS type A sorting domain-containing protein [Saprospiraceae bacterium]|nr:T9SS type A sorting domain-containing protein [Saprospiraceae bacterium]